MGVTVESSSLPLQQVCAPAAAGFNNASFRFIINCAPPPPPPTYLRLHTGVQKFAKTDLEQQRKLSGSRWGAQILFFFWRGKKGGMGGLPKNEIKSIFLLVSIGPGDRRLRTRTRSPCPTAEHHFSSDCWWWSESHVILKKNPNDISERLDEVSHSREVLNGKNANMRRSGCLHFAFHHSAVPSFDYSSQSAPSLLKSWRNQWDWMRTCCRDWT